MPAPLRVIPMIEVVGGDVGAVLAGAVADGAVAAGAVVIGWVVGAEVVGTVAMVGRVVVGATLVDVGAGGAAWCVALEGDDPHAVTRPPARTNAALMLATRRGPKIFT